MYVCMCMYVRGVFFFCLVRITQQTHSLRPGIRTSPVILVEHEEKGRGGGRGRLNGEIFVLFVAAVAVAAAIFFDRKGLR